MKATQSLAAVVFFLVVGSALSAAAAQAEGVVNINSAGAEELMLLPRVGPAVAERIIEFRDKNGEFKSKEELMLVRGIGEATYALIEPYVSISGATTLSEKVRLPKKESQDD